MNRIVHFEIQAEDPERAATFYKETFGWKAEEWVIPGIKMKDEDRYWLITTGPEDEPGINGGLLFRKGPAPVEGQSVNSFVCTIDVASVDESLDKVLKAKGTVVLPRMAVKGIGWLAYCKDTEGNLFGIMQEDENAE
ncbi:VOC family protein [Methanolobus sp. ZRKC2]|uniref:VOC family protein n=1 Tax=Methanolobus sp. ZRKC2 TaxID=3125783 RepID=UPI0032547427